ncbi:MAG: precorrin-2 C(20)-methyltransferase [Eubacteriales bacterium]|nr:precorrin-2 C(20)-methyltransferase [Eubacteriales bacterium]
MTEEIKNGIFYGVSVGPGDPELLSLKALRILKECPVWAVPRTHRGNSLALSIVEKILPAEGKEIIYLDFPMQKDPKLSRENHQKQLRKITPLLGQGINLAMPTLGDVSTFSTVQYLVPYLEAAGFETVMIPGITSFAATAAKLSRSLTERDQPLVIIPAANPQLDKFLKLPGTKVIMKAAKKNRELLKTLKDGGYIQRAAMVSNCGLEDEQVYPELTEVEAIDSYFSTIIISAAAEDQLFP